MIDLQNAVKELMTKDLITVSENTPLSEVADIFKKNRVHHIPVVDFNTIVGIISSSDFLSFKGGLNSVESKYESFRLRKHHARDIMTTGLAKLDSQDKIGVAVKIFEENLFHAIPIEENNKLVGILTTYDLIKGLSTAVQEYSKERQKAISALHKI